MESHRPVAILACDSCLRSVYPCFSPERQPKAVQRELFFRWRRNVYRLEFTRDTILWHPYMHCSHHRRRRRCCSLHFQCEVANSVNPNIHNIDYKLHCIKQLNNVGIPYVYERKHDTYMALSRDKMTLNANCKRIKNVSALHIFVPLSSCRPLSVLSMVVFFFVSLMSNAFLFERFRIPLFVASLSLSSALCLVCCFVAIKWVINEQSSID